MSRQSMILACIAVLGLGVFFFGGQNQSSSDLLVGVANAQEVGEVDTSTIVDMQLGDADAPVTVVEYASFTCPHCARFHEEVFPKLKAEYIDTGKVKFIYRDVYFDRPGLWAAAVARCDGPEKFFGISGMIYKGQSDWARAGGGDPSAVVDALRKIGRLAGLDNDHMEACLQDGTKMKTLVAWFQENAERDEIRSTPSLIVNGVLHQNMGFEALKEVIEADLK